jgi:hypothetical protein
MPWRRQMNRLLKLLLPLLQLLLLSKHLLLKRL